MLFFPTIFTKEDKFYDLLFVSLHVEGSIMKERLKKLTPIEKGGKKENGRVTSHENIPITLLSP